MTDLSKTWHYKRTTIICSNNFVNHKLWFTCISQNHYLLFLISDSTLDQTKEKNLWIFQKWKSNLNVRFVLIFSSRPSGWPLVGTLFAKNVWQKWQIFLGYALYAGQSNDNDLTSWHAISVWKQLLTLSRLQERKSAQLMICQKNFVSNISK